jgi:hypothetical protein
MPRLTSTALWRLDPECNKDDMIKEEVVAFVALLGQLLGYFVLRFAKGL